ncbi:conserved exported hypothetical protein [Alteromonas sp. 38]|uniref:DUF2066 domain-containing protein n=1 Tax=Alteromonas TaxID=226 RepID=UPI0012F0CD9C|nr:MULTISPECIES: DUF2066 domain-containing protein [Alteromonas]CAD5276270.1 conserved exported hypothetical protein [Alteromonas sp. 154]VXB68481.1 conserved exported hypothetical protein [Alteromonas sp. 38]
MFQQQLIRGVGVAIAVCTMSAHATQHVVVNEAQIPVSDQSQKTQANAVKKALTQVMVKVSGNTEVLQNPGVRAALRTPEAYLRSYRFSYSGNETYYVAEFDKTKLTELMKREGLPLWGERRPETIVWLATETDDNERIILDESTPTPVGEMLVHTAKTRGVPVSLPLMDLTDSASISIYDVWGRFVQSLTASSQRYGVDNIIGARLYKNTPGEMPSIPEGLPASSGTGEGGVYQDTNYEDNSYADNENQNARAGTEQPLSGQLDLDEVDGVNLQANEEQQASLVGDEVSTAMVNEVQALPPFTMDEFTQYAQKAQEGEYALDWVFVGNGKVSYGSIFADEPTSLTQQLVDAYANYLSSQYAVIPGAVDAERVQISVSVANVDSLKKYANANAYLKSLSVIEEAMLTGQTGSVATYNLTLLGTPEDLLNTVRLESKLRPVTDSFGQVVEGYTFYWNE